MKEIDRERLRAFHDELLASYCGLMSGERNVLFKMKELWCYMAGMFADGRRTEKRIKKAVRLQEYKEAVDAMFYGALQDGRIYGGQGRNI